MTQEALKLAIQLRDTASGYWTENEISIIAKLIEALAQRTEQEPLAWVNKERNTITWDKLYPDMDALFTTPPQRTWVGLTDDEVASEFYKFEAAGAWYQFAQAIEAKLKERNQ